MSITFLFVGVLGLFTENAVFQFHWYLRLLSNQAALWISVPFQGLYSCSVQNRKDILRNELWYILQQFDAKLESCTVHCTYIPEANFTNFFLPRS